jgi:tRNA-Thr(GGU) m(6)t(6)A37 methyltransferase TsaA
MVAFVAAGVPGDNLTLRASAVSARAANTRFGGPVWKTSVMTMPEYAIRPVGHVVSPLNDPATAPKQGDEGSPEAWLVFGFDFVPALDGIRPGTDVLILTWLDRADRDVLTVHPRGDESRPLQGVFATRSPHRPNPVGLHRVTVVTVAGRRLLVRNLEALDGTPIVDVKPVLDPGVER